METADLIAVGEIVKAQGIKGEVKVVPLTDNPARFGKLRRIIFKDSNGIQELKIEKYRLFKQFILLKFEGIDDLNAANLLGRGLLMIPRSERLKLPPGRYYHDEIEGLQVYSMSGDFLGRIERIIETGSNDVYLARNESNEILIPALKSVVKLIDTAAGRMEVDLPVGLVGDE